MYTRINYPEKNCRRGSIIQEKNVDTAPVLSITEEENVDAVLLIKKYVDAGN